MHLPFILVGESGQRQNFFQQILNTAIRILALPTHILSAMRKKLKNEQTEKVKKEETNEPMRKKEIIT